MYSTSRESGRLLTARQRLTTELPHFMSTQGINLYPQDFAVIYSTGWYQCVSTNQLLDLHYSDNKNPRSGMNRLTQLTSSGFLSRVPCYPAVSTTNQKIGKPTYTYLWKKPNQHRLKSWLEEHGRASEWQDRQFDDLAARQTDTADFSPSYLPHEVGITEFFKRLERACEQSDGRVSVKFWRRTSPFARDIGKELFVEKKKRQYVDSQPIEVTERLKRPFHPDAVFCLQGTDAKGSYYNFFFLEYDNNSAAPERYTQKLEGYKAYWQQGCFPALLAQLITDHNIPIRSDLAKIGFRALTVTPIPSRRDTLFLASLELRQFSMLYFAALPDLTPERILSNAWLRGKEYTSIAEQEKTLAKDMPHSVKSRWLTEQLAAMPKVSLVD